MIQYVIAGSFNHIKYVLKAFRPAVIGIRHVFTAQRIVYPEQLNLACGLQRLSFQNFLQNVPVHAKEVIERVKIRFVQGPCDMMKHESVLFGVFSRSRIGLFSLMRSRGSGAIANHVVFVGLFEQGFHHSFGQR